MKNNEQIYACGIGVYLPLESVKDETFNSGLMGPGFGIEPEQGIVFAPAAGTISMIFPTGHAIGITTSNGLEILIHIGIDTVQLDGKGFTVLKKVGDKVAAHEEMIHFDMELIRNAGLDFTIMQVFTNGESTAISLNASKITQFSKVTGIEKRKEETKMKDTSTYEYGKLCSEILQAVGGSKNIKNVFHCVTRLRIVPINRDIVDMGALEHINGV